MGLGFLGAGKMATALASGWKAAGLADAASCLASDVSDSARQLFTAATGFSTAYTNKEVLAHCKTIIVAVKPQVIPGLLEEILPRVKPEHLFISIVAGIKLETLSQGLGTHRVIRVMPNTPCLVGESATAYSAGHGVKPEDDDLAGRLFGAVGKAFAVPESYLNAVTGLSGSGPAFIYVLIEALADGGVRAGLPRDLATSLAAQTVLGSAKMVLETGEHPGQLKDMVASPGGTTIAGLHALEKAGFRGALIDAVLAATQRAKELGG
ncbi:MAG: pyrroline-5-carboxylate reductase [Gemmataceae bacterium]|nr:pyrroline-5-carboxylate reductase [Gemmataceae bacterium]